MVTDDAIQHLLIFPSLRCVDLGGTQITDEGVRALSGLPTLEQAIVPRKGVSSAAVSYFPKSLQLVSQRD